MTNLRHALILAAALLVCIPASGQQDKAKKQTEKVVRQIPQRKSA